MIKLKWVIAYHGAAYQGWQAQKTGRGVQSVLEEVLQRFCPLASRLCGSSRTDTGVHAMGMVAHVELPKSQVGMRPEKLRLAMNAHLPSDIRVVRITRVPKQFQQNLDPHYKMLLYIVIALDLSIYDCQKIIGFHYQELEPNVAERSLGPD